MIMEKMNMYRRHIKETKTYKKNPKEGVTTNELEKYL